ncbi:DUF1801 domain-containing protein [Sphingomonas psychrotolerans]|uniref:YdhG-like domain-containing protein n=1 Tax=Sphingomonas psychrotolerans TaxID=1327635 RepID=A0A2K8MIZ2_9SPHN|nr:DUF1801 domain-containing protein [Sphingomonas psychrotolerans]ATY33850.1 hypothetical protein CVN68_19370 [Sphingomonas psychrotolerans]
MAEIKTKATPESVDAFIEAVSDPVRRADAKAVAALMAQVSGETPAMWGATIIGFGSYHYRYDSGHEGEMCRLGFSPRKTELVLYVLNGSPEQDAQLARLGKHKTGKACLYIKKLADVDLAVLEELMRDQLTSMDARYPR